MVVHIKISTVIQQSQRQPHQQQQQQHQHKQTQLQTSTRCSPRNSQNEDDKTIDTIQPSNDLMANVYEHEQLRCRRRQRHCGDSNNTNAVAVDHYRCRGRTTTTTTKSAAAAATMTISALAIKLLLSLWILFMACNCCCWHFIQNATAFELAPPVVPTNTVDGHVNGQDYGNPTADTFSSHATTPQSGVAATDDAMSESPDATPPESPEEIQKAVCTVTAGEVRASAEAVTTKTLKGVCSSVEMNNALQRLEQKFADDLHDIKLLLQQIATHNGLQLHMPQTAATMAGTPASIASPAVATTTTTTTSTTTTPPSVDDAAPRRSASTLRAPSPPIQLKSLPDGIGRRPSAWREHEVSKFNNTMLSDKDFKVFTYYWKLENFTAHIERADTAPIESPVFSIKGKALHLKAYFQHLHRDFLYLQLAYASSSLASTSRHNNIILDMGGAGGFGLFKEIATNTRVIFKHKISILDQNNERSKDLVSQEFHNMDMGFLIPNSALLGSPFIKNDTLLIQIFLYL